MNLIILRQLLADSASLNTYLHGEFPEVGAILRSLFLAERQTDTSLPDYLYRNRRDMVFDGATGLAALLLTAFDELTTAHLEMRRQTIFVQADKLHDWQHLLAWMPPLPMLGFMLHRHARLPTPHTEAACRDYIEERILPNCGNTALPRPYYPELEALIEREGGLSDLHIHLTGTTEADHVWLHSLENPSRFYLELRGAVANEQALEQLQQIEPGLNAKMVHDRLRLAALLRARMVDHLFAGRPLHRHALLHMINLSNFPFSQATNPISFRHPLRGTDHGQGLLAPFNSLSLEALFYVKAFHRLEESEAPDHALFSQLLHLYLLLFGFFNKLIVQQTTQKGFDQFQKITVNEVRSAAEKNFCRRFQQINGNNHGYLGFIEGRFSPKETVAENRKLLATIFKGFAMFQGRADFDPNRDDPCPRGSHPQLRLVAHFIKKADDPKAQRLKVRHHSLRLDLARRGQALLTTMNGNHHISRQVTAIDAAANEMHAGPEVFAPLYRLFRRRGFTHFTFHVGEDFVHLLSGLRAIDEAVRFLDLRSGDRIGHATAVGIDPRLWLDRCNNGRVVITRQEWLDDLVYAHDALNNGGAGILHQLEERIEALAYQIYQHHCPLTVLKRAWRMRQLDPMIARAGGRRRGDALRFEDQSEWDLLDRAREEHAQAFALFLQYHESECAIRGAELMETEDIFNEEQLRQLQQRQLAKLCAMQIVIESMPTSNVRISFYHDHGEHHLLRWLKGNDPADRPTVCLGSDDPGIFATNIVNEYAHAYHQLIKRPNCSRDEATETLRQLAQNAHTFRFDTAGD